MDDDDLYYMEQQQLEADRAEWAMMEEDQLRMQEEELQQAKPHSKKPETGRSRAERLENGRLEKDEQPRNQPREEQRQSPISGRGDATASDLPTSSSWDAPRQQNGHLFAENSEA